MVRAIDTCDKVMRFFEPSIPPGAHHWSLGGLKMSAVGRPNTKNSNLDPDNIGQDNS